MSVRDRDVSDMPSPPEAAAPLHNNAVSSSALPGFCGLNDKDLVLQCSILAYNASERGH